MKVTFFLKNSHKDWEWSISKEEAKNFYKMEGEKGVTKDSEEKKSHFRTLIEGPLAKDREDELRSFRWAQDQKHHVRKSRSEKWS